jgi:hypothetical protein
MQPPDKPSEDPKKADPAAGTGRSRYAGLVEEARIARAGGGVARIPLFYQALMYLVLLAVLLAVVWLAWYI